MILKQRTPSVYCHYYGINEAGVLEEIPLLDKLAADERADVIDIHAALKDHPELLPDRVHPTRPPGFISCYLCTL